MDGNWVAECTLCKWMERHDEQDDALKAASIHAMKEHTEQQATLAYGKWITHVQNRAADTFGFQVPAPPEVLPPSPEFQSANSVEDARASLEQKPAGE